MCYKGRSHVKCSYHNKIKFNCIHLYIQIDLINKLINSINGCEWIGVFYICMIGSISNVHLYVLTWFRDQKRAM